MIGRKATGSLSLQELVEKVRADADEFIDARARAIAKETPGVPFAVVRGLITNKAPGCECRQVEVITKELEAIEALEIANG